MLSFIIKKFHLCIRVYHMYARCLRGSNPMELLLVFCLDSTPTVTWQQPGRPTYYKGAAWPLLPLLLLLPACFSLALLDSPSILPFSHFLGTLPNLYPLLSATYTRSTFYPGPQVAHLAGIQVAESHYPFCLPLWSLYSHPQANNNLLTAVPFLSQLHSLETPTLGIDPKSASPFHSCLFGQFFALL